MLAEKQATARSDETHKAYIFKGTRSRKLPVRGSIRADSIVPIMKILPHSLWEREKCCSMLGVKTPTKNVCPKLEQNTIKNPNKSIRHCSCRKLA